MSAYELRTYQIAPNKMPEMEQVLRDLVQTIMPDYNMEGVGYWSTPDGSVLYYVVRHRELEVIASDWEEFHADPRWLRGVEQRKYEDSVVTHVATASLVAIPGLPPEHLLLPQLP